MRTLMHWYRTRAHPCWMNRHKEADDLVVIMGRNLFNSLRLPVLNSISGQNPNAELLAGQLILSSRTIRGLGVSLRRSSRIQRC